MFFSRAAAARCRKTHGWKIVLGLAACLPWLVQCTPNRAYRDQDTRPWRQTPQAPFVSGQQMPQYEPYASAANPAHPFDLSYIEFDEKGDFWDRRQLAWTAQEIRRAAQTNNVVLVVYVHGWQNDASDLRGHDVAKFHCLLERLAEAQGKSRRFFGVYLSWRGKSVPGGDGWYPNGSVADAAAKALFFLPHELSFFGRKNAATRVAGMPMTEAIFETVRASRTGARESGRLTRSILIGHSFGALVVEKALAQALAAQVITSDGAHENNFVAPADFIVLLNSAGESIYAKEMQDLLRRRHTPVGGGGGGNSITARQPLIVSVTSTADFATGKFFPLGTGLSNAGGGFRKYEWDTRYGASSHNVDQREYFTTTPGHNDHLVSHRAVPETTPAPPTLSDDDGCSPNMLSAVNANLTEPLVGPDSAVRFVTMPGGGPATYWTLKPIPGVIQTPYWIVEVPREIMRDHSDIFNENSLALLARLFRLSNPAQAPGITISAQPRTMRLVAPGVMTP
ncbi:MAG: hypothetical protein JO117_09095 [Verrucomicrobia bacterium]|nr:hypothetical protein [Verrucomicrobiota bacterium]